MDKFEREMLTLQQMFEDKQQPFMPVVREIFEKYLEAFKQRHPGQQSQIINLINEIFAALDDDHTGELIEKIRIKMGNVLYIVNKYPDRLFFHEPWIANDEDVIQHFQKNLIKIDEQQAEMLAKEIIQVKC